MPKVVCVCVPPRERGGGSFYLRLPKQAAAVGQTSVTNFLPKRRRIGGSGGF